MGQWTLYPFYRNKAHQGYSDVISRNKGAVWNLTNYSLLIERISVTTNNDDDPSRDVKVIWPRHLWYFIAIPKI